MKTMAEHHHHGHSSHAPGPGPSAATGAKDPVCGMDVIPEHAAGGSAEHAGTTYGFCSPRCREKFTAEPTRYIAPLTATEAPSATDERIHVPMHPEYARRARQLPEVRHGAGTRSPTRRDVNPSWSIYAPVR